MIIVHFFTRTIRRKVYLMMDSSASKGAEPLWDSAEVVCEVDPGADPDAWLDRAKERVLSAFPELNYLKTMKPRRRKGATQVFDMLFELKPKEGGMSAILNLMKGKTR